MRPVTTVQTQPAKRIGYLLGGFLDAKKHPAIDAGERPNVEYYEFARRFPNTTLLDFHDAAASKSSFAKAALKRGQPGIALAWTALSARPYYDAFLCAAEDTGIALALISRLRLSTRPIYIITHGSFFAGNRFRQLIRLIRDRKNITFLTISQSIGDKLISEYGAAAERVQNISYGVDTDFFKPASPDLSWQENPPIVVSVGAESRDYKTLTAAAEGLDLQVRIGADSGWFKRDIDIQNDTLPLHVDVRKYNFAELRDLYARSLFAVVPTYLVARGCGYTAIVEAMAMGKPVISTRITCYGDFIIEGETGFFVPPGDIEALRERMRYLLDHPEIARSMGTTARRHAESLYSVSINVDRIASAMGLMDNPVPMLNRKQP